jgi:hypothetical protein
MSQLAVAIIMQTIGAAMNDLVSIPLTDIREAGPVRHALDGYVRARALGEECLAWLPP